MAKKPAKARSRGRRKPARSDAAGQDDSRSLLTAVQAALQRAPDEGPGPQARRIDLVADALVAKACAGDVQAIKAVFERIDGKAGAEPEAPQALTIVHTFVQKICQNASVAQHSAMVSLCFNIGCDAFSRSSVARLHNKRRFAEAAQGFGLWNKSRGVVLPGLVARRAAEAALYLIDVEGEQVPASSVAEGERPLRASRSLSGSAMAAGATGLSFATELAHQASDWKETVFQIMPYFEQMRWVLLGLSLIGISVSIYARLSERREGRN